MEAAACVDANIVNAHSDSITVSKLSNPGNLLMAVGVVVAKKETVNGCEKRDWNNKVNSLDQSRQLRGKKGDKYMQRSTSQATCGVHPSLCERTRTCDLVM